MVYIKQNTAYSYFGVEERNESNMTNVSLLDEFIISSLYSVMRLKQGGVAEGEKNEYPVPNSY